MLRESRGGTLASAPRPGPDPAQGPAPPPPRPPPPQAPNLVPSPAGRVTARRLSDLGFGGPWEVLGSSPGTVPAPDLSSALSPRCLGSRALGCRKVTTPPPNSGGDGRSDSRLKRTPLTAPGVGAGRVTAARMMPLPLGRRGPAQPPRGSGYTPHAGPEGLKGSGRNRPLSPERSGSGIRVRGCASPLPARGRRKVLGSCCPYLAW